MNASKLATFAQVRKGQTINYGTGWHRVVKVHAPDATYRCVTLAGGTAYTAPYWAEVWVKTW
jgi:hypothetical protein